MITKYLQILDLSIYIIVGIIVFYGNGDVNAQYTVAKGDESALRNAIEQGADVNGISEEGVTTLHTAIESQDIVTVKVLLEYGAKYDIPNGEGQTALEMALLNAFGFDTLTARQFAHTKTPDDTSVQVLRAIMHEVRKKKSIEIDIKGTLAISLEKFEMDTGGISFISRTTLKTEAKRYGIILSAWETEYIGMEKSGLVSEWSILLRPAGIYRVVGFEKDGIIEVAMLELVKLPPTEDAMVQPLTNWLPSTMAAIKEHTWRGKFSGTLKW